MGVPVLLIGESGTGKSTSLHNFKPDEIGVINVLGKPLPFRGKFNQVKTKDVELIKRALSGAKNTRSFVIDDFGYTITDTYMRGSYGAEKFRDQYEVFKKIGSEAYNLITFVQTETPDDAIVYFVMHSTIENGQIVPATVGKMLNEKINLVGMFTITIYATIQDGEYKFIVNGMPPAKSPEGMFPGEAIDNDLKAVDSAIREYWGMRPIVDGEQDAQ